MLIYTKLRHAVQMFSQMSRIPDLFTDILIKKAGAAYVPVLTSINDKFEWGSESNSVSPS